MDGAAGLRWRLQTEDGDATAIRAFDDDRLIVNMSVWGSLDALGDFVYRNPAGGRSMPAPLALGNGTRRRPIRSS